MNGRRLGCRLAAGLLWAPLAACGPDPAPPTLDAPLQRPSEDVVRVAATAMATPLIRHLAEHFAALDPRQAVRVEEPLGAAGALRAVDDGVIDAAVVALPLGEAPPPGAVAIGATRVILAAGPGVAVRRLSLDDLVATVSGAVGAWPDGTPRRFFLRPEQDVAQAALGAAWPPLGAALGEALARGPARRIARDDGLAEVLRRTAGSLVVVDEGQLRLRAAPVWFVALEDAAGRPVAPRLVLYAVPGANAKPRLLEFLKFLAEDGRGLAQDVGYEAPP